MVINTYFHSLYIQLREHGFKGGCKSFIFVRTGYNSKDKLNTMYGYKDRLKSSNIHVVIIPSVVHTLTASIRLFFSL